MKLKIEIEYSDRLDPNDVMESIDDGIRLLITKYAGEPYYEELRTFEVVAHYLPKKILRPSK